MVNGILYSKPIGYLGKLTFYENNEACSWLVSLPAFDFIKLTVLYIDTYVWDPINVYDGIHWDTNLQFGKVLTQDKYHQFIHLE